MSSEQKPNLKRRWRFGSGDVARGEREDGSTVDDILESMNRRTALSERLDQDTVQAPEEEQTNLQQSVIPPDNSYPPKNHPFGKAALAFLASVGIVIILLYGTLADILDLSVMNEVVQSPTLTALYSDPVKLAALAVICLIPILVMKRIRNRNGSDLTVGHSDRII